MTILLNDPTASDHLDAASPVCRVGVGPDANRIGLVLDYRGDHPPLRLLLVLREHGWSTPTPLPPPAGAIDWSRPDPVAGRPWSLRPYRVRGALAVPGPAASRQAASVAWLEHALGRLGLHLETEFVPVASVRETRPGMVEVLDDELDDAPVVAVDPFAHGSVPAPALAPPPPSVPTVPAPVVARSVDHVVDDRPTPTGQVAAGPVDERAAGRDGESLRDAPLQWMPPDPAAFRAVTVVLRAGLLEEVTEVLERWDLVDEAVFTMVSGVGRGGGRTVSYRGQKRAEPLSRVCLTVPVEARDADALADALTGAARHGEKGDGKVWVV